MTAHPITITDPQSGSAARILPELGFNLFELILPGDGELQNVLWAEEGFETGEKRPSGSGVPLLFPFPGRLRGTTLEWKGRAYQLEAQDGRDNAIHGFVYNRPWRVVEQGESFVQAQFQAGVDAPEVLDQWPADFGIEVRYSLQQATLECRMRMWNPADETLPCGLGLHPYFRIPRTSDSPDEYTVQIPVTAEWPLEEMLPTGERRPLDDAERFAAGLPFSEMQFDNVFSGTRFDADGRATATIMSPRGQRLVFRFGSEFPECVVYTPPHRNAVCVEPYSSLPGAVQLPDGPAKGLWLLEPGQERTSRWSLTLES